MNIVDCVQGDPIWFASRRGCVTASRVADVAKKKDGKDSAARKKLKSEMLAEILTGQTTEHFVSVPMQFGIENEGRARAEYEIYKGIEVEQVGFVFHPTIARAGASPDGLVGSDGLVELKVPNSSTHLDYIIAGKVPEEYKPQLYWQMACCERQFCDFVSFDPRLADEFQLFICRLERDDKVIAEMEAEVEQFISEVNAMALRLQQYASDAAKGFERNIRKGQTDAELMRELAKELVP